jgi:hypothetical protein
MHEKLWAGPELKLQYAQFHFDMMSWSIQQPEPTSYNVALQSSGAIIDRGLAAKTLRIFGRIPVNGSERSRDNSKLLWR